VKKNWAFRNDDDERDFWIDWDAPFDNREVFIYAGSDQSMNESAIRFADGLFGNSRSYPVTQNLYDHTSPYPGSASPDGEEDFLLLSQPSRSCPRMQAVDWLIQEYSKNVAMKQRITQMLEKEYFPLLRELTGNQALTSEQAYEYAEYIDAARKAGFAIDIGPSRAALTDKQLRLNDVAANANKYDKFALTKDQWYLQSQEVRNLLLEVSRVVSGLNDLEDTTIISKYWERPKSDKKPKLFSLTGGDETMIALLGVFNNFYLPTPDPGSIFAVDFYKCVNNCDRRGDEVKVEVSYCANGKDIEGSCKLLEYDSDIQDRVTTATNTLKFETYLTKGMYDYEDKMKYERNPKISNICAWPYF
jgi:hypothetical protein